MSEHLVVTFDADQPIPEFNDRKKGTDGTPVGIVFLDVDVLAAQIAGTGAFRKRDATVPAAPSPKLTCRYGHAMTPENTYRRSEGYAGCRQCKRETQARYKARLREAS